MKFDLAWGHSGAVRDAFINTYHQNPKQFAREELSMFDYPEHDGDPELIKLTRAVIKRQTDQEYKHVFLVNGATGGVVIALRAYAQQNLVYCMTRQAPYYVRYPSMISASGLTHVDENSLVRLDESVVLLDMPSNPLGLTSRIGNVSAKVVLDGVYLNRVYAPVFHGLPPHEIMVGSYSKLLGLNGIRIGWVATNDDLMAERLRDLITSEYCGLSTASTELIKHVLEGFHWELFESFAKHKLFINRDEWSRLERFFDGTPTPENGMFYYGPMDKKAQEIFSKAGVTWTKGSALGTDDGFARFNLGASEQVIQRAVAAVLKEDRI